MEMICKFEKGMGKKTITKIDGTESNDQKKLSNKITAWIQYFKLKTLKNEVKKTCRTTNNSLWKQSK